MYTKTEINTESYSKRIWHRKLCQKEKSDIKLNSKSSRSSFTECMGGKKTGKGEQ